MLSVCPSAKFLLFCSRAFHCLGRAPQHRFARNPRRRKILWRVSFDVAGAGLLCVGRVRQTESRPVTSLRQASRRRGEPPAAIRGHCTASVRLHARPGQGGKGRHLMGTAAARAVSAVHHCSPVPTDRVLAAKAARYRRRRKRGSFGHHHPWRCLW
ncbi:hypothetical protein VFPFJ_00823 [Purpureocillium lilacinum]|uniref:Uncharacterized protein n=1 Tax=Purpureocillium lilacinum TaxID=33203 RepID=A0A179HXG7_PURLI|nr:hypothetical protein VFPFJ_00823 [Purpureocillium lilacinum]OAQ94714.1 hypothetical protein VFPFJ_00823 [Purpureocillium lilacinum]